MPTNLRDFTRKFREILESRGFDFNRLSSEEGLKDIESKVKELESYVGCTLLQLHVQDSSSLSLERMDYCLTSAIQESFLGYAPYPSRQREKAPESSIDGITVIFPDMVEEHLAFLKSNFTSLDELLKSEPAFLDKTDLIMNSIWHGYFKQKNNQNFYGYVDQKMLGEWRNKKSRVFVSHQLAEKINQFYAMIEKRKKELAESNPEIVQKHPDFEADLIKLKKLFDYFYSLNGHYNKKGQNLYAKKAVFERVLEGWLTGKVPLIAEQVDELADLSQNVHLYLKESQLLEKHPDLPKKIAFLYSEYGILSKIKADEDIENILKIGRRASWENVIYDPHIVETIDSLCSKVNEIKNEPFKKSQLNRKSRWQEDYRKDWYFRLVRPFVNYLFEKIKKDYGEKGVADFIELVNGTSWTKKDGSRVRWYKNDREMASFTYNLQAFLDAKNLLSGQSLKFDSSKAEALLEQDRQDKTLASKFASNPASANEFKYQIYKETLSRTEKAINEALLEFYK